MSSPDSRKKHGRVGFILGLAVFLSSCGQHPGYRAPVSRAAGSAIPVAKADSANTLGQRAATVAVRQIGVPYRYGGNTVAGFDCSGLAQFAYSQSGKKIPRTTKEQWRRLAPVARNDLQVGDLLFFRISGNISHVGMYLGKNRFVHAPSSGRDVGVEELNAAFYERAFVRGGRP